MSLTVGRTFRMTRKTKLYLRLYHFFDSLGQWFINHVDFEEE